MNVRRVRAAGGFSLIEMMLVIAIIGTLMAVVAYNLVGMGDRANRRATEASMKVIANALDTYYLNEKAYPPSDQLALLVTTGILSADTKLQDGWNTPFFYLYPGSEGRIYDLISFGKDKLPGTPDDINAGRRP